MNPAEKMCIRDSLEDGALSLKKIIPYTTRPMRRGETDGVEYYFCGEKELADLLKRGKVIELRAYDTVQGVWKYFTVDDHQIQDCLLYTSSSPPMAPA